MGNVFGKINLSVLVNVESNDETLGLLQANYKLNPERIVKWKLVAIDPKGNEEDIEVCNVDEVDLNEIVNY